MLENYSKEVQAALKSFKIGERISVFKSGRVYEGLLMPRSELGDTNCIVLKLDSGYNIGIGYEKGTVIEKSKNHEPRKVKEEADFELEKERVRKVMFDSSKPSVSLIMTGGTIINRVDYKTGGVAPLEKSEELWPTSPSSRTSFS